MPGGFRGKGRKATPPEISALVDNMFSEVFTPAERQELLVRIEAWEDENPGLTGAARVTGWIDVAYSYQAEKGPRLPDPD